MIKVNINLPVPHYRVHADPDCPHYRDAGSRGTRVVRIDSGNLQERLSQMGTEPYRFLAQKGFNSMWIEFDLPDHDTAMNAIRQVKEVLDCRHLPIRRVAIETHCTAIIRGVQ